MKFLLLQCRLFLLSLFFVFYTAQNTTIIPNTTQININGLQATAEVTLINYNTKVVSSCAALGFDYFDSSSHECYLCPTNQDPDFSTVDVLGNAEACKCKQGFVTVPKDCSTVKLSHFT